VSTQLAVALITLAGAVITVGFGVWNAKRERGATSDRAATASTAQQLREEAVELLTETALLLDRLTRKLDLVIERDQAVADELPKLDSKIEKLVLLRGRLHITAGISAEEIEAFSDAMNLAWGVAESTSDLGVTGINHGDADRAAAIAAVQHFHEDFQLAVERFVRVAQSATRR